MFENEYTVTHFHEITYSSAIRVHVHEKTTGWLSTFVSVLQELKCTWWTHLIGAVIFFCVCAFLPSVHILKSQGFCQNSDKCERRNTFHQNVGVICCWLVLTCQNLAQCVFYLCMIVFCLFSLPTESLCCYTCWKDSILSPIFIYLFVWITVCTSGPTFSLCLSVGSFSPESLCVTEKPTSYRNQTPDCEDTL